LDESFYIFSRLICHDFDHYRNLWQSAIDVFSNVLTQSFTRPTFILLP